MALPSGRTSRVKAITTFDGDLESASAPLSVALTLEDELDISRGEMLAAAHEPPTVASKVLASLVWMDAQALDPQRTYLLKHTSQTVKAMVGAVRHRVNINTLEQEPATTLEMNAIGVVELETSKPLFVDLYAENRATGSFILIDPVSNATVAAGMIREALEEVDADSRLSHGAAVILAESEVAALMERELLSLNVAVVRTQVERADVLRRLLHAGVVVLVERAGGASIGELVAGAIEFVPVTTAADGSAAVAARVLEALRAKGTIGPAKAEESAR